MVTITTAESKLKQKLVPGSLGIVVIDLVMWILEGLQKSLDLWTRKVTECSKLMSYSVKAWKIEPLKEMPGY